MDTCVRVCVENFTRRWEEAAIPHTTEMAYIEGATARKHTWQKLTISDIASFRLLPGIRRQASVPCPFEDFLRMLDA